MLVSKVYALTGAMTLSEACSATWVIFRPRLLPSPMSGFMALWQPGPVLMSVATVTTEGHVLSELTPKVILVFEGQAATNTIQNWVICAATLGHGYVQS